MLREQHITQRQWRNDCRIWKKFQVCEGEVEKISLQLGLSVKFADPCNHVCYFHYAILQISMKILSRFECDTEVQRRMEEQV